VKKAGSLLMLLLALGCLTNPVLADGIIIIDPPPEPPPDWSAWLSIRYHRVQVSIENQVTTTRVDQVFRNDSHVAVEGDYVFPLPPGAVVDDFTMWVDGKPIEAEILEADKAREIYESYVRQRQDPALLEYVGRDTVRARIFPIPPGEERRVELSYTQVLPLEDGLMHYRYPLDTERFSSSPLEQVSIQVNIKSRDPLGAIYSSSHQNELVLQRDDENHAKLSYEASNLYPQRDFELYVGLRDKDEIEANVLSYKPAGQDGFFLLMLAPALETDRVIPKDLMMILDTSGSMDGEKLNQAKAALRYVLSNLNSEDRFNIIAFDSNTRSYAQELRPSAEADDAQAWVQDLEALGGTNIYLALSEALQQIEGDRPTVLLFLTDGLPTEGIIDEQTLLQSLSSEAPEGIRIFPFGVGYDVNTILLDQMASEHRGRPAYVTPDERIDEEISKFYGSIQRPLLTDITLDFGELSTYDIYPQPLPDLYAGTQLIVVGRYTDGGPTTLSMTGELTNRQQNYLYESTFTQEGGPDFIPRLWAARKIGHLLTQIRLQGEREEWVDAVVQLSTRYGIITPYTSFLIEEEDVLTSEKRETAADTLQAYPTPPPSGQNAVEEAEARLGLGGAQAPPAVEPITPNVDAAGTTLRNVGDTAFLCADNRCVDTRFIPDQMSTTVVRFGSENYWALARTNTTWAPYMALAQEVIFLTEEGNAIHIQTGDDVVEDPLPLLDSPTPTESADASPTPTSPTTEPAYIPADPSEEEPHAGDAPAFGFCPTAVLLAVLCLLVGMLYTRH
jgi:Ca-activated chloride channel family protein